MAHGAANRGPLVGAVAVLVLLALVPTRWSGWTRALSGLVKLAEAPVSEPVHRTVRWVMRDGDKADSAELAAVERDRDHFKWMWLQEQRETERLKKTIEQLQRGAALYSDLGVVQLARPVIGGSSDGRGGTLEVRAGSSQGVAQNDVVTTEGVQLVGKIVGVHAKTCTVELITSEIVAKGSRGLTGIVMTDNDKPGAICSLYPFKGSMLHGQVAYSAKDVRPNPVVGQTVRLEDSQWPKHAQRLVIGVVTDVKTVTTGRQVIEVKPTVDLDRLGEVILRLTPRDADERLTPVIPAKPGSTDGRQ